MKRHASRLHALESAVRRRQPRPAARSFKMLRMEGSAAAAHVAPASPPALPKDLEQQVAVVRGRAIGTPSSGLLQLERRLLQPSAELAPPAAQARLPIAMRAPAARAFARPTPRALGFAAAPPARAATPVFGDAFAGKFEVEAFDADAAPSAPLPSPSPARATARDSEARVLAADFEKDLAQMLDESAPAPAAPEDKQWDDTLRAAAERSTERDAPTPREGPPPTDATQPSNAHDVFNQMGVAMDHANRFDLGAVDLAGRFDRFDSELALAPRAGPPVPVAALALDDLDVVADLADLTGAPAASQSTAAAQAVQAEQRPSGQ
jgi:hypothetical protein